MIHSPGVGKTHLAISLAVAAAESGRRVYFGTLSDLIESLEEAHAAGQLKQRLKTLTYPALLVVDELGYLTVTANGAKLFFQLISSRYGRASTVLTSNKGFEEWGEILHDEVMAAALLDRLLHRCHIVNIRATATGCGTTGSFPGPFIRRLPGPSVPSKPRSRSSHDDAATQHPGPRSGRSASFAGAGVPRAYLEAPRKCAIFNAQQCAIFDAH